MQKVQLTNNWTSVEDLPLGPWQKDTEGEMLLKRRSDDEKSIDTDGSHNPDVRNVTSCSSVLRNQAVAISTQRKERRIELRPAHEQKTHGETLPAVRLRGSGLGVQVKADSVRKPTLPMQNFDDESLI